MVVTEPVFLMSMSVKQPEPIIFWALYAANRGMQTLPKGTPRAAAVGVVRHEKCLTVHPEPSRFQNGNDHVFWNAGPLVVIAYDEKNVPAI